MYVNDGATELSNVVSYFLRELQPLIILGTEVIC